jgi:hypothetical protein
MRAKTAAALLAGFGVLLAASHTQAQDLGPHFKKIKDGIFTYAGKPQQSNCTIILTQEGVVVIDSGDAPTDSQAAPADVPGAGPAVDAIPSERCRFCNRGRRSADAPQSRVRPV